MKILAKTLAALSVVALVGCASPSPVATEPEPVKQEESAQVFPPGFENFEAQVTGISPLFCYEPAPMVELLKAYEVAEGEGENALEAVNKAWYARYVYSDKAVCEQGEFPIVVDPRHGIGYTELNVGPHEVHQAFSPMLGFGYVLGPATKKTSI